MCSERDGVLELGEMEVGGFDSMIPWFVQYLNNIWCFGA
jgi:hypothetical protein